MNLPNRLTMLRILLIPVCVFLQLEEMYPWALGVFCAACVTDFLDGYLARKNDQVTVFGKFADPVADKLLVLCAMIALSAQGRLPAWCVCVVAARELAVDGLRLVAAGQNIVVAAAMAGKIKTNLQMLCVIVHASSKRAQSSSEKILGMCSGTSMTRAPLNRLEW